MHDLFGDEPEVIKPRKQRGHAAPPGGGPEGETCGTCKHHTRIQQANVYHKCGLMRHCWTGGQATDLQEHTLAELRKAGAVAFVARSVDEVELEFAEYF